MQVLVFSTAPSTLQPKLGNFSQATVAGCSEWQVTNNSTARYQMTGSEKDKNNIANKVGMHMNITNQPLFVSISTLVLSLQVAYTASPFPLFCGARSGSFCKHTLLKVSIAVIGGGACPGWHVQACGQPPAAMAHKLALKHFNHCPLYNMPAMQACRLATCDDCSH